MITNDHHYHGWTTADRLQAVATAALIGTYGIAAHCTKFADGTRVSDTHRCAGRAALGPLGLTVWVARSEVKKNKDAER